MLQGIFLSPIQHLATVILDWIERYEKEVEKDRELRLFLVASGKLDPLIAFSELKPSEEVKDDNEELPDDEEEVLYKFTDTEVSAEDVERELRELAALAAQGSTTFESITFTDWV